jgi:hypothetical protein
MNRDTPSSRRLDVEWIAMKAGIKPGNRVTIAPERAAEIETRARREGLSVARGLHMVEFPGRPPSVILYLAHDEAYALSLAKAEAPLLPPENATLRIDEELVFHARLGQLLGFPSCCVDEFGVRLQRGITRRLGGSDAHEDFVAAECAARGSRQFLGRLNDLLPDRRVRIVTFYPCRYDCPTASAYAAAVFAAAVKVDALAAAELRAALVGEMCIGVDGTRGPAATPLVETLDVDFATF